MHSTSFEGLFDEEFGEATRVVADDGVFFEEIIEDDADAEFTEGGEIDDDGFGAFGAIAFGDFGRHGPAVGDNPIDDAPRSVFLNGAEVVGQCVASGFARLSHEVGDVDARGFGFSDGLDDFRKKNIREDAGVEGARAEED